MIVRVNSFGWLVTLATALAALDVLGNWGGNGTALAGRETSVLMDLPAGAPAARSLFDLTDGQNRIVTRTDTGTSTTPAHLAYDAAGNLTCDGLYFYQYDAWNRLVQVNRAATQDVNPPVLASDGHTPLTYIWVPGVMLKHNTYDGLGRLIRTQSPYPNVDYPNHGVRSEHFYYDGKALFVDRLDAGVVSSNWIEYERIVPFGHTLCQNRNRVYSPRMGRFLQADPNHTGSTVIAAVEAPDGSITLPIDVTLDQRGLTTGKLVSAIAVAAGQVVATAVLSAPVKLVAGFASLFGDTQPDVQWVEEEPVFLAYPDGVTTLSGDESRRLNAVLERARTNGNVQVVIEHEMGGGDALLTSRRANPPRADASALADDLRVRRKGLIDRRSELLAPAAAWALGVAPDTAPRDRLRRVDLELADLDDSMDHLYDLQKPGAETLNGRRARSAAVELIDARLTAVRRSVDGVAGSRGASRIAIVRGRADAATNEQSRLVVRVRQRK